MYHALISHKMMYHLHVNISNFYERIQRRSMSIRIQRIYLTPYTPRCATHGARKWARAARERERRKMNEKSCKRKLFLTLWTRFSMDRCDSRVRQRDCGHSVWRWPANEMRQHILVHSLTLLIGFVVVVGVVAAHFFFWFNRCLRSFDYDIQWYLFGQKILRNDSQQRRQGSQRWLWIFLYSRTQSLTRHGKKETSPLAYAERSAVSIAKDLFRTLSQSNAIGVSVCLCEWVNIRHKCQDVLCVFIVLYRYVINCLDSDILCWMWHITYIYKVVLLIHSWMLHSRWLNCIGAPNASSSFESTSSSYASGTYQRSNTPPPLPWFDIGNLNNNNNNHHFHEQTKCQIRWERTSSFRGACAAPLRTKREEIERETNGLDQ